jgi:hypothetical protein
MMCTLNSTAVMPNLLGLVCRGLAAAWHLAHVEVLNHNSGQRATFMADAWLDAKLGTTTLMLKPTSGKEHSSLAVP